MRNIVINSSSYSIVTLLYFYILSVTTIGSINAQDIPSISPSPSVTISPFPTYLTPSPFPTLTFYPIGPLVLCHLCKGDPTVEFTNPNTFILVLGGRITCSQLNIAMTTKQFPQEECDVYYNDAYIQRRCGCTNFVPTVPTVPTVPAPVLVPVPTLPTTLAPVAIPVTVPPTNAPVIVPVTAAPVAVPTTAAPVVAPVPVPLPVPTPITAAPVPIPVVPIVTNTPTTPKVIVPTPIVVIDIPPSRRAPVSSSVRLPAAPSVRVPVPIPVPVVVPTITTTAPIAIAPTAVPVAVVAPTAAPIITIAPTAAPVVVAPTTNAPVASTAPVLVVPTNIPVDVAQLVEQQEMVGRSSSTAETDNDYDESVKYLLQSLDYSNLQERKQDHEEQENVKKFIGALTKVQHN